MAFLIYFTYLLSIIRSHVNFCQLKNMHTMNYFSSEQHLFVVNYYDCISSICKWPLWCIEYISSYRSLLPELYHSFATKWSFSSPRKTGQSICHKQSDEVPLTLINNKLYEVHFNRIYESYLFQDQIKLISRVKRGRVTDWLNK